MTYLKNNLFNFIQKNKVLFFFLIIFLINFSLKIYKINSIPPGATYDEMVYVTESQMILEHGTDLSGQWRPSSLSPSNESYSELTSTTLLPGLLIFPNNPIVASKIVPILMGSLIPIFLALMVYYFFQKKIYLFSTALITTFNPWVFQFSRMGFDSIFSSFFYLLGLVILFYAKKWWKLSAIIAFFWGFFQYQGHKVVLFPLLLLVYLTLLIKELFRYKKFEKNRLKTIFIRTLPVLMVLLFSLFLTVNYFLRLDNLLSSSRKEEISVIDQIALSEIVNDKRKLVFDSPLTVIYNNKVTAQFSLVFKKVLRSFDPHILFLQGNSIVDTFAVLDYGFFHKIDLLFIFIFFLLLIKSAKKPYFILFFILSFTLLGILPTLIKSDNVWITFRNAFSFFGLMMMIGVGLALLLEQFKSVKSKAIIVFMYLLFSSPFFYNYFFRYPIAQTLHKGFYYRVLANYIDRQENQRFILVTDRTDAVYNYLFTYNQYIKVEDQKNINQYAQLDDKELDNGRIKILAGCPENLATMLDENTTLIIDNLNQSCAMENSADGEIRMVSLIDSGTHFFINNDQLCSQYLLQPFLNMKENNLAVERLDQQKFCRSFFLMLD
jgi:hypothetical protein